MEAFQNIYKICFSPLFFTAIVGLGYCLWQRGSINKKKALIFGGIFIFMMFWRIVMQVSSVRYAVGLIPFTILFIIYIFVDRHWQKWIGEKWRMPVLRLLQVGLIGLFITCIAKTARVKRRYEYIQLMVKAIEDKASAYKHPVMITFAKETPRISYYSNILKLGSEKDAERPEVLKSTILVAIKQADILFLVFSNDKKAQKWLKRISDLYPDIVFRKMFEAQARKEKNVIYTWVNDSPIVGTPIKVADIQETLNASDDLLVEDFEKPVKFEIGKNRTFKALQTNHASGFEGKYFKFVDSFKLAGQIIPENFLGLTNQQSPYTIAGNSSLFIDSKRGYQCLTTTKRLPVSNYEINFLFKGNRGTVFFFDLELQGSNGKKLDVYRTEEHVVLFNDRVRAVKIKCYPAHPDATTIKLSLLVRDGAIAIDNFIVEKIK